MDIREYKSYGPDISISLPKGSRFLGARYSLGSLCLYFEVARDYTVMESWQMVAIVKDQTVTSMTGWSPDMYQFLAMIEPSEHNPLLFLFRNTG